MTNNNLSDEKLYEMKNRVCDANLKLKDSNLVVLTWGNTSEINRDAGIIVIKPSGVPYDTMSPEQMVVTDLDGNVIGENSLKPSSDLDTHVYLYKHFENVNAIVHTHSTYAVMWAQSRRDIPAYGTTHADTFYGSIPVTRQLTKEEVEKEYELATGKVIVERFENDNIDPIAVPGVLTVGHGPFTWGNTPDKAVENSIVLDEVAHMALMTEFLNPNKDEIPQYLLDKHYFRKHGANAYYGQ
ncbi:L-ribulose-5-phosphate 4-epimerase [Floricoccus penangensis]|uniref:L-ribulose-5-phosphate 4-epimerase n=1 Tax=Floricoccus penangensis TaxID=1859475 RepID=A0A9Q5NZK0_9LACT|nr:L-ribulose-5-phosphate 4-epimerase AraD [Floricoccus penangensis]OFI46610.1 L-ribulose-5-phosphate 4-epimerase [Floricoccus penangensis]